MSTAQKQNKQRAYSDSETSKNNSTLKHTNTIQDLVTEIQDLESEIIDMFEVAFHFAGLDPQYFEQALKYYTKIIEHQDEIDEYSAQSIIDIITKIKYQKPQWFLSHTTE